jgi:hypothetical protein
MKHPVWITGEIVDAVAKTRGYIIDWADEIEKGITAAINGAVEEEREACAKIVEDKYDSLPDTVVGLWGPILLEVALQIRARSTASSGPHRWGDLMGEAINQIKNGGKK